MKPSPAIVAEVASEAPKQPCIACRTLLEAGATICPTCKSWQKKWKNSVTFYGGFVTAAVIIFSAVTYIGSVISEMWSPRYDAEVLNFKYPGSQTYANPGTNDVFLEDVEFYCGKNNSFSDIVGAILKRGTIYVREATTESKDLVAISLQHPFIHNKNGDGASLLPRARISPIPDTCFAIHIYSKGHFSTRQMTKAFEATDNSKLAIVNAEGTLRYYSLNGGTTYTKSFPAELAFVDLQRPGCP